MTHAQPHEKTQFPVASTFDVAVDSKLAAPGNVNRSELVPETDDDFVFRTSELSDFLAWHLIGNGEPLQIFGHTGSGKSSLVTQVAARLNIELLAVSGHRRMEFQELQGFRDVVGGNTFFVNGPLTDAMLNGRWLMLEEGDAIDESVNIALNLIAEGRPMVINEGDEDQRVIHPHPDFRLLMLGNTGGLADTHGAYPGTRPQNLAFLDRFWCMEVDYPDKETELRVLKSKAPGLPDTVNDMLVDIANQVRDGFKRKENVVPLSVTLSTRGLIRMAKLTLFFWSGWKAGINPVVRAMERTIGFRAPEGEATILRELVERHTGDGSGFVTP